MSETIKDVMLTGNGASTPLPIGRLVPVGTERRFLALDQCELRAEEKDGKVNIRGYAAVYNSASEILWDYEHGKFREYIMPGAFDEALKRGDDVYAFVEHESHLVLGRVKAGNLILTSDNRGLHFDVNPPDTQLGRDTRTNVQSGILDKASFQFSMMRGEGQEWKRGDDDVWERRIHKVSSLRDISVVAFPAYSGTIVEHRSIGFNPVEPESDTGEIELAEARLKLVG